MVRLKMFGLGGVIMFKLGWLRPQNGHRTLSVQPKWDKILKSGKCRNPHKCSGCAKLRSVQNFVAIPAFIFGQSNDKWRGPKVTFLIFEVANSFFLLHIFIVRCCFTYIPFSLFKYFLERFWETNLG